MRVLYSSFMCSLSGEETRRHDLLPDPSLAPLEDLKPRFIVHCVRPRATRRRCYAEAVAAVAMVELVLLSRSSVGAVQRRLPFQGRKVVGFLMLMVSQTSRVIHGSKGNVAFLDL